MQCTYRISYECRWWMLSNSHAGECAVWIGRWIQPVVAQLHSSPATLYPQPTGQHTSTLLVMSAIVMPTIWLARGLCQEQMNALRCSSFSWRRISHTMSKMAKTALTMTILTLTMDNGCTVMEQKETTVPLTTALQPLTHQVRSCDLYPNNAMTKWLHLNNVSMDWPLTHGSKFILYYNHIHSNGNCSHVMLLNNKDNELTSYPTNTHTLPLPSPHTHATTPLITHRCNQHGDYIQEWWVQFWEWSFWSGVWSTHRQLCYQEKENRTVGPW